MTSEFERTAVEQTPTVDETLTTLKESASKADLISEANKAIDQKQRLEDVVVYGFQQGYPAFVKKLEEISSRSLRRAWAAAVMGPLLEKPPHFSYPEEKEAYQMAIKLDEYKFSMIVLGLDKYGPNLKGAPSATVSSAPTTDGPGNSDNGRIQSSEASENSTPTQEEANLSENVQPGTSSENTQSV